MRGVIAGSRPEPSLIALVRERMIAVEDPATSSLIEAVRPANVRGYLTRGELIRICRWKSPRSTGLVRENGARRIRTATEAAIRSVEERERFERLLSLRGVSAPSASAVLTMLEPGRYGVIDIRVWQLLHAMGAVRGNARGAGFTLDQWLQFLHVLRGVAAELDVTARAVERTLFAAHRERQVGTLYPASKPPRP